MATDFINLNYFFRADTQDYQLILRRGFFDNHKTIGEYGKGIYLTDNKDINLNGKNIILNVDLALIDDILFVESYESLLKNYIPTAYQEFLNKGRTNIIGRKYIKAFADNNQLNGFKIKNENILILYNTTNIRFIRLFNEDLKTLRNFSAPTTNTSILVGDDEDTNPDVDMTDNTDDSILYGNF